MFLPENDFYYERYNIYVMIFAFLLFLGIFLFVLRKYLSSIIDPLLSNVIWSASGLALLFGYFYSKGINLDGLTFALVYFLYIAGLFLFLDSSPRSIKSLEQGLNNPKNLKIFIVCLLLNIGSRLEFISYALSNPSIEGWFMYKFVQWEGRSFWQYILQLGARPFFIYYIFVLIKTKRKLRPLLFFILIINSILDIIAGGRSSLLGLLDAFGYYVFYFYPLFAKRFKANINRYGIILILLSIFNTIVVTSFYGSEGTVSESALRVTNRLLSAGDGLEIYLANNASNFIKSGVDEYVKAAFGIFIKRVSDIQTQSIGWQLWEINTGRTSPISVGPNFILPLQLIVLGKIYLIPYVLLISYIVSFLRGNSLSKKIIQSQPLSFVFGLMTFQVVIDMEFFALQLCACLFVYYIFIFPVKYLTIKFDWINIASYMRYNSIK